MALPNFNSFIDNPNYTVGRYASGEIEYIKAKPQAYIKRQTSETVDKELYTPEEYYFNPGGSFLKGTQQGLRVVRSRGDSYAEEPYNKVVYETQGDRLVISTYETVSKGKNTQSETVKFLERDIYEGGARIEYTQAKNLTPTQKENIKTAPEQVTQPNLNMPVYQKETVQQQALILQAGQQYAPGSPKFEGLRASRLAETKKKIPETQNVEYRRPYGTIKGEVKTFNPDKSFNEQYNKVEGGYSRVSPDVEREIKNRSLFDIKKGATMPREPPNVNIPAGKQYSVYGSQPITQAPYFSGKDIALMSIQEQKQGDFIDKFDAGLNYFSAVGRAKRGAGATLAGEALIFAGNFPKTFFYTTPPGIVLNVYKYGLIKTAQMYNPLNTIDYIKSNVLISTASPGGIILKNPGEVLGTLGGGFLGGKLTTDITYNVYEGARVARFNSYGKKLDARIGYEEYTGDAWQYQGDYTYMQNRLTILDKRTGQPIGEQAILSTTQRAPQVIPSEPAPKLPESIQKPLTSFNYKLFKDPYTDLTLEQAPGEYVFNPEYARGNKIIQAEENLIGVDIKKVEYMGDKTINPIEQAPSPGKFATATEQQIKLIDTDSAGRPYSVYPDESAPKINYKDMTVNTPSGTKFNPDYDRNPPVYATIEPISASLAEYARIYEPEINAFKLKAKNEFIKVREGFSETIKEFRPSGIYPPIIDKPKTDVIAPGGDRTREGDRGDDNFKPPITPPITITNQGTAGFFDRPGDSRPTDIYDTTRYTKYFDEIKIENPPKVSEKQDDIISPIIAPPITEQIPDTKPRQDFYNDFPRPPKQEEPKKDILYFYVPEDKKPKRERLIDLYDVQIRQGGNYRTLNVYPLPKYKALNLGANVVDNTALQTFKIIPAGRGKETPDAFNFSKAEKFIYTGGKFKEKAKARIDTTGELLGISAKGWKKIKNKRWKI